MGLIQTLHRLLRISSDKPWPLRGILYNEKKVGAQRQFNGMTNLGDILSKFFHKISPWMTPNQMLVIARK